MSKKYWSRKRSLWIRYSLKNIHIMQQTPNNTTFWGDTQLSFNLGMRVNFSRDSISSPRISQTFEATIIFNPVSPVDVYKKTLAKRGTSHSSQTLFTCPNKSCSLLLPSNKKNLLKIKSKKSSRWFKVTFLSPSWRSLSLWKGHLTIPKRARSQNCQADIFVHLKWKHIQGRAVHLHFLPFLQRIQGTSSWFAIAGHKIASGNIPIGSMGLVEMKPYMNTWKNTTNLLRKKNTVVEKTRENCKTTHIVGRKNGKSMCPMLFPNEKRWTKNHWKHWEANKKGCWKKDVKQTKCIGKQSVEESKNIWFWKKHVGSKFVTLPDFSKGILLRKYVFGSP